MGGRFSMISASFSWLKVFLPRQFSMKMLYTEMLVSTLRMYTLFSYNIP